MSPLSFFLPVLFAVRVSSQSTIPAASVASQYSLSTSTSIPFPQATLNNDDTQSFIKSNWGLSKGRIQSGASNLVFVKDPFPNSPAPGTSTADSSSMSGPVLQVQYAAGSYQNTNNGGAQFYAMWNSSGSAFQSMLISYEVAFDSESTGSKAGSCLACVGDLIRSTAPVAIRQMGRTASVRASCGGRMVQGRYMPMFHGITISATARG